MHSDPQQARNGIYLAVFFAVVMSGLAPAYWRGFNEPRLDGDLTRVGFYSENDFGWNSEQIQYEEPLFSLDDPDREFHIVIVGDSFSNDERGGWPNALAELSGLNVGVFELGVDLDPLLDPPQHRGPRVLILESVERSLATKFEGSSPCDEAIHPVKGHGPLSFEPLATRSEPYERDSSPQGTSVDIGYELKRLTYGRLQDRVRRFALTRSDLFSNARPDEILIFSNDFNKGTWDEETWKRIACRVNSIEGQVRSSGNTEFVFLVAPDKSTVYGEFGRDGNFSTSKLDHLYQHTGATTLDIRAFLRELIEDGEKDVYLPNDTHWSPRVHRAVAREIARHLTPMRGVDQEQHQPAATRRQFDGNGR